MEANPVFLALFFVVVTNLENGTFHSKKYRWLDKEAHFLQDFERIISLLQELMFPVQDTQNIPTVLNPTLGQRQSWGTYIFKAATPLIMVCSYWRPHGRVPRTAVALVCGLKPWCADKTCLFGYEGQGVG